MKMAEFITDHELLDLPEDPADAFATLKAIADVKLAGYTRSADTPLAHEHLIREYLALIIKAAEEYGITELEGLVLPNYERSDLSSYRPLLEALERCATGIRLKRARRLKQYSTPQMRPPNKSFGSW